MIDPVCPMKTPQAPLTGLLFAFASLAAALTCHANTVYKPGELRIEAASGLIHQGEGSWDFEATNFDPYTKPVTFPAPFQAGEVKAVSIELEKERPAAGDRLELYLILDNRKGVTATQRLAVPIVKGRHRYVFETEGIRWFKGRLTGLRIDPGTRPGAVSIKSIGVLKGLSPPGQDDIVIPVPEDLKPSLGAAFDTFEDAALVRYRIASEHLDYAILADHHGQSKVLKVHVRNSEAKPRLDTLNFASKRVRPFSPVIPPYIGLHAEKFSISLWVDAPADLAGKGIRLETADGSGLAFSLENTPSKPGPNGWREFSWPIPDAGQLARQITGVQFTSDTPPKADTFVFIARPLLTGKGFEAGHDLLTTDAPRMIAGMASPLASSPARALPTRDALSLGGYEIHKPEMRASIPALAAFIKNEFPQWDFILAPVWTPPLSVASELPALPEGVYFQFQKARLESDYLLATDRMPRNARGEALQAFGNAVLATDPVIQAGLKDEIDYAASLGVNNFKQVDYVWPYAGGRWGYDKASVVAYREALTGTDEGLLLLPGLPGGGRLAAGGVIRFWDYYEYYHGFRLQPADLGLADWAAYTPVSEQQAARGGDIEKRNLGAYILLYHYEWLRQAQRFGRWAKAHDGTHSYTLNPEDLGNAGDYVFLTFLADAGVPYIEYFGGPSVLRGAYHNLPFYTRAADLAGKKLGLTLEKGQSGHGQHYFDPEINYLYAYELAAAGLRNYHNEWIESDWHRMADPANAYLYDRWSNWMTGALGFTFAREAQVRRPESRVFNISVRSPGYYVSSWIWGLNQGPSFGPLLAEHHVPYQQWDRSAMPDILDEADILFYSPLSGRPRDWTLLRKWLKTPGKVLITHSNVPFNFDDGQARLAPGTANVTYTSIDQRYSDFLTEKADFKAVVFPEFQSLRPLADGTWSPLSGARILLGDEASPLLSSLTLHGEGRILYLHKNPLRLDSDERALVARTLAEQLNLPRTITASSAPVVAHRFASPHAEVLNVWAGLDKAGFKGGYGAHLLPRRGADQFDRHNRPYPWLDQGREVFVEVPVRDAGAYRVYAFLSGEETLVEASGQKTLRLAVKDASAEQFYYAKDGPLIREKIEDLKKHRERLFPYCPDLPRGGADASQTP